jgi:hypothetical protein
MAGIVSRRPVAGIVAGIFFGALGLLIIQTESSTGMTKGFPRLFSGIVGYLLLCLASLSIVVATISILKTPASRKELEKPADPKRAGPGTNVHETRREKE